MEHPEQAIHTSRTYLRPGKARMRRFISRRMRVTFTVPGVRPERVMRSSMWRLVGDAVHGVFADDGAALGDLFRQGHVLRRVEFANAGADEGDGAPLRREGGLEKHAGTPRLYHSSQTRLLRKSKVTR